VAGTHWWPTRNITNATFIGANLKQCNIKGVDFSRAMEDARVAGVVKSQIDADLVYACRLEVDGRYMCCTQKLKPCGGLSGALCKHLLILVIGLARAGKIDLTSAARWVLASTVEAPTLKKDTAADLFLKYEGTVWCNRLVPN
jgi:hypothetical protein